MTARKTVAIMSGNELQTKYEHELAESLAMQAARVVHGDQAPLVLLLAKHWSIPAVSAVLELWGDPLCIAPDAARAILRDAREKTEGLEDLEDLQRVWEVQERSLTCGVFVRPRPSAPVGSGASLPEYQDEERRRVMDEFQLRKAEAAQAYPKRPEKPDPLSPEAIAEALKMLPDRDTEPAPVEGRPRTFEDLAAEARSTLISVGHPWEVVCEYFRRVDGCGPLHHPDRPNRRDLERVLELVQRWDTECKSMAQGEAVQAGEVCLLFDGSKCLSIQDPADDPVEILTELAADTPKHVKITTAHRMILDQRFAASHESGRRPTT